METAISIIVIFAILGLGVMVLMFIKKHKRRLSAGEMSFVRNQWRMLSSGKNMRNSILEADKLIDYVLGKYGYTGSMGEKLKKAQRIFTDINAVWAAHKIRNRLAHELEFHPTKNDVDFVLASFGKALRDLEIEL
ncbi:MAG: hypothetical protein PHO48_00015 [Candidatus Gracilibacteria bacterium]|nr:hypothetical protein [Candidatus Gracilibacteria bacterium]MDD5178654.1 hypothetical protein [Candidatus Gracilibacteria bacterium]